MPLNKFSITDVRKIVSTGKKGRWSDGGGLCLQVSGSGCASWIFRFRSPDGTRREMGLGALHTVTLAAAREAARLARVTRHGGQDPMGARAIRAVTFDQCVEACLKDRETNKLPTAGWLRILTRYASPAIGAMSVAAITTDHVLRMLTPLWTTKTETASKLRRYTEAVIAHATHVKKLRGGENPAGWALLRHSLQSTKKIAPAKSFASMDPIELPSFMVELAAVDDIAARALEVLILTVSRRGDIIGQKASPNEEAKPPMRWADVDLERRIWTIPKDKMGNQFQVPLSDAVITILRALPRKGERVFPMDDQHRMWKLFKTMRPDVQVHGFRSTFSGWAKNRGEAEEVVEAALKHKVYKTDTQKAYSSHVTRLPGRTRLMQLWGEFATGIEAKIMHLHTA
jgi:hypothetical protein